MSKTGKKWCLMEQTSEPIVCQLFVNVFLLWNDSFIIGLTNLPVKGCRKGDSNKLFSRTCTFQRNILFTWFPAFYCLSHIFLSSTRSWHKPASRRVLFVFWNFHFLPPPLRKKKKGPSCWERGKTPEKRFLLSLGLGGGDGDGGGGGGGGGGF